MPLRQMNRLFSRVVSLAIDSTRLKRLHGWKALKIRNFTAIIDKRLAELRSGQKLSVYQRKLLMFCFSFIIQEIKIEFLSFLLGLMCFILIENIREKTCNQITVQNLRIKLFSLKINVHFYIWRERERQRERIHICWIKKIPFSFLFFCFIKFIWIYRNEKQVKLFFRLNIFLKSTQIKYK